jgi:hypothetical protein
MTDHLAVQRKVVLPMVAAASATMKSQEGAVHPVGVRENGPAIYRWDGVRRLFWQVQEGRLKGGQDSALPPGL